MLLANADRLGLCCIRFSQDRQAIRNCEVLVGHCFLPHRAVFPYACFRKAMGICTALAGEEVRLGATKRSVTTRRPGTAKPTEIREAIGNRTARVDLICSISQDCAGGYIRCAAIWLRNSIRMRNYQPITGCGQICCSPALHLTSFQHHFPDMDMGRFTNSHL